MSSAIRRVSLLSHLYLLQECKQSMKLGASKHYSSLTDIFECQKQCLEKVQSEMREVTISVNTNVEDDDQSFLRKLESTMMQIKNLKKEVQAAPLTVTKPQLIAPQVVSTETLQQYMKSNCYLHNLADPEMCKVEGTFFTLQSSLPHLVTITA